MDPEQRLVVVHERIAVKIFIFLVRTFLGILQIQGRRIIQRLILHLFFFIFVLALFLFLFLGFFACRILLLGIEVNIIRHERAVFADQLADGIFFEEIFFPLGDMHDDFSAASRFFRFGDRIGGIAVRFPLYGGLVLIALGVYLHIVGNHIGGIETESEMSDDAVARGVFILLQEILRARKSDLSDVFFHFFGGHADAVVFHGQSFCFFVHVDVDAIFLVGLCLRLAHLRQLFELGDGVHAVGDDFPKENILVRIQPFLDDGHHVFA